MWVLVTQRPKIDLNDNSLINPKTTIASMKSIPHTSKIKRKENSSL